MIKAMEAIPYKVIKTEKQYFEYCKILEEKVMQNPKTKEQDDVIELLTLLIEKWDEEHNTFSDAGPIEVLRYLMEVNNLKSTEMATVLGVSKSLFSDILHYRRGLSKEVIRKLSERFKVSQELFNRPYKLISPVNSHLKDASVMNTVKILPAA
jgi:HTH-type transcriptional regulator/antitoxin HigA